MNKYSMSHTRGLCRINCNDAVMMTFNDSVLSVPGGTYEYEEFVSVAILKELRTLAEKGLA